MIQPALLLLLLAMSSPVFGTEISVHHYCVSVCSLTTKVCTTGCVRDLLDEVSFLGNNIANQPFTTENASQCRQECTKNVTCQYFTFVDENAGIEVHRNKCFLKASTGDTPEITIQHLQHATSGYSLRNCSGKVTYSAKKYSLVPEKKNWTEAQEYCRQHYTNLAIIRTEEDWKAIQSSLGNFSGDVWIGLHRSGPTEKWKWSDGEDFMFFNWEKSFGVHTEGHNCVFSLSSHWQPVDCAAQRQYMCQRVHHGNGTTEKVYDLMPGPKTQQDAETDCRTINGRELASICNQKEQEAFDELTTKETWIGLEHNKNNTLWEWSNGEPFQQRELTWGDGNCQQLNSDRKWTPKDCSNQSAFFCYADERPLNTTGDLTIPVTPETTSPTSTGPTSIKTSTTTPTTLLPTTTIGQSITSPPTSTSSGQLTSLGPNSPDRNSTSSPSCTTSPLHPDYLHYFNESKSWINALKICKSRHSNLVHITNQTVLTDLTQLLANVELPCGGVWIGLERSIFEWSAPWLWTSGDVDKVVKYSEWHSCFPLNPINYHCGKMVWVGNGELKWLDASCHQELPFICQDLH
ncbi:secretory phospholipase A2 receptor isoform X2 [Salmo salar]|uniref:Secretory phospholipase A2 receptor isoform X2 n=1 Tax=Salmo salar TaxID=8030 RepID=A0A1S3SH07_SALSA|nr:secretory phospholipase A2 receptor-like isoform X2 [Salmo salar]|eukprot:XP_014063622.1 PREDICTED: secretory phospholipase A2 receptor-like isoform X2 [Salmo salar]